MTASPAESSGSSEKLKKKTGSRKKKKKKKEEKWRKKNDIIAWSCLTCFNDTEDGTCICDKQTEVKEKVGSDHPSQFFIENHDDPFVDVELEQFVMEYRWKHG